MIAVNGRDVSRMTDDELLEELSEMRARASSESIAASVAAMERAHGMSTAEMCRRVAAGEMEEDLAVCRWLIRAHVLGA